MVQANYQRNGLQNRSKHSASHIKTSDAKKGGQAIVVSTLLSMDEKKHPEQRTIIALLDMLLEEA